MKQIALVTGGTRGIGRAIVERLQTDGFDVIACGRSEPAHPLPGGATFRVCDVADLASVQRLFAGLDRLDVLVNNAGLAGANPLDGDDALWHAIIATNLHGAFYCAKTAVPLLPDTTGRIINIASTLGLRGVADSTAYCAAKHGVVGLTRALAHALAPRRITVNAVCPGWVRTDMAAQRYSEIGITEAAAASGTPTGRVTKPSEIADAVAWLTGPGAGNVTGQTIVIDGGWLA